jgi:hypothetical protein
MSRVLWVCLGVATTAAVTEGVVLWARK